jgi:putative protein-disulfide isomerase
MSAPARLHYVHDPMCSWCWAFTPMYATLRAHLSDRIEVHRLLGGLAPDTDRPMPEEMRAYLQATWREIERRVPGTRFNFDFWRRCTPRRATYPACRAVIAARRQGAAFDTAMTRAIQHAYYLQARNPSDDETLVALAGEIGLDVPTFVEALHAPETRERLRDEISLARALGVDSFPSLVLETPRGAHRIPVDYLEVEPMLEAIGAATAHDARPIRPGVPGT